MALISPHCGEIPARSDMFSKGNQRQFHIKKPIFMTWALVFSLCLVFYIHHFIKNEAAANTLSIQASNYPGIDIAAEIEECMDYNMAIHYPVFQVDAIDSVVSDYTEAAKTEFLKEVDANIEFLMGRAATMNLSFKLESVSDDFYSVVFTNESYVGGANGKQNSQIFLVDMEQKKFVKTDSIVVDCIDNRETIHTYLLEAFRQSKRYSTLFFEEELYNYFFEKADPFEKMYLKESSLVFKFDKYDVTAGAAGSPEMIIPLQESEIFLTARGEKLLLQNRLIDNPQESGASLEGEDDSLRDETEDQPFQSDTLQKRVALTFDDGPHPQYTLEILNLLEEYDAKATFFMLGNRADFYPDIVREVADRGHEIGNHTWNHKQLTRLSDTESRQEIGSTSSLIEEITGEKPVVFRPPYGAVNERVSEIADMPVIMWTVDTLDWKHKNPETILSIVKTDAKDNSVILLHDIHKTTVSGVKLILEYLSDAGYEFITVSGMTDKSS